MRKRFLNAWEGLAWVYLICFILLRLLWLTPLLHWWPLELLNMFGVWFYAPFVVILPLLCWPRGKRQSRTSNPLRSRANYWVLIPLSLFVVEYGGYFWPNLQGVQFLSEPTSSPSISTPISIRVMTWNIHKDNRNAIAITQHIIEQDADIVAIQELGVGMAEPLAIALHSAYPHQALAPSERPDEFALFSRYPIEVIENSGRGNPDCACQSTTLDINGQAVTILNVHLPLPKLETQHIGPFLWVTDLSTTRQRRMLEGVLQRIEDTPELSIALGDFNLSDRHPHYRLLSKVVQDAFRAGGTGFGLTYPAVPKVGPLPFTPLLRLDYIWHQDRLATQRAWTGAGAKADHQCLVADLMGNN